MRARDLERVGRELAVDERILLVLDDRQAAGAHVVEEAPVRLLQGTVGLVGAAADHDGVEAREIAVLEVGGGENLDRHADVGQELRHLVRGAEDIADAGERRQPDVGAHQLEAVAAAQRRRRDVRIVEKRRGGARALVACRSR